MALGLWLAEEADVRELIADLFKVECDAIVITTNGFVKKNGRAVMGRGVALTAAVLWPGLPELLGEHIKQYGNHVAHFRFPRKNLSIFTMPVKDNWMLPARLDLIERSCRELVAAVGLQAEFTTVCLPRPGCGNGQLCWESCADTCLGPVKPAIAPLLDDRFVVVFPAGEGEVNVACARPEEEWDGDIDDEWRRDI